jgi:hypothetical protein
VAHEALHPVLPAVARIAHARAHHGLQVEGQPVFGAAGNVMHVEPHGPQKVPGPAHAAQFLAVQQVQLAGNQLVGRVMAESRAHHPVQRLQVAQAAAAFLDVRLHQEGAFAEAAMAFMAFGLLGGDEAARAAGAPRLVERLLERFEQGRIAGDQPRIDQAGADGQVVFGIGQAMRDAARGVAHLQAEIPHEIQHELDHAQRDGIGFVGRQEQQVDIAERREHGPAIAAGGGDADAVRQAGRAADFVHRMLEQRAHHAVGQRGQALRRLHPRHAVGFEIIAHLLLDAGQMAAENAQHQVARRGARLGAQIRQRLKQGGCGVIHHGGRRQGRLGDEHWHHGIAGLLIATPRLSKGWCADGRSVMCGRCRGWCPVRKARVFAPRHRPLNRRRRPGAPPGPSRRRRADA